MDSSGKVISQELIEETADLAKRLALNRSHSTETSGYPDIFLLNRDRRNRNVQRLNYLHVKAVHNRAARGYL